MIRLTSLARFGTPSFYVQFYSTVTSYTVSLFLWTFRFNQYAFLTSSKQIRSDDQLCRSEPPLCGMEIHKIHRNDQLCRFYPPLMEVKHSQWECQTSVKGRSDRQSWSFLWSILILWTFIPHLIAWNWSLYLWSSLVFLVNLIVQC